MKNCKVFWPINTGEAKLTSGFWGKRVENYLDIIDNLENALMNESNSARLLNFGIAAGEIDGEFYSTEWSDGDCYKFIEGCCNQYAVTKDDNILKIINKYIPWIEASQETDGYICTQILLTDKKRWEAPENHELYNFGHLFTAACVHYESTNDPRLLNVAINAADYLLTVFLPLNKELGNFGFNPSQIMGLVDLYRTTGNKNYLELANIFVSMRGTKLGNGDQNQNRIPLRKETQPVGHAVTASYLYAGAADMCSYTQEDELIDALKRIWKDMITRRIYITGGVGPLYNGISERGDLVEEAFGDEYDLPNRISYNETCANIAAAMWARRMLTLTNEATYGDWMENILYNAGISGSSLDMKRYFYANPLSHRLDERIKPTFSNQYAHVPNKRFLTFDCWCCPPQLWRTFTGMPKWIYSTSDTGVSINLFVSSILDTKLNDGSPVKIELKTNYPWDGKVTIEIIEAPDNMDLSFRIPDWCNDATFNDKPIYSGIHNITVNKGQSIYINLPMKVTLYRANPLVEQANGMFAVKRGPVVYCLESCDIEDGVSIDELAIDPNEVFHEEIISDLPYDMIGLKTKLVYRPKEEKMYYPYNDDSRKRVSVRFVPYFSWANRTESDMSVWFPQE